MDATMFREWRVAHQYTAEELASQLGTTANTIHRWERGEREPASWRLLELALHGLLFTHGATCRCPNQRCRCRPNRYAANGRSYDPY
jgi:transcriptional regulator with XRE-family HTH domain